MNKEKDLKKKLFEFYQTGELSQHLQHIHHVDITTTYRNDVVFNLLNINYSEKIIEIGCSKGFDTLTIAKKASFVVGIDISLATLKAANTINKKENISYVLCDAEYMPFKQNVFDSAVCLEVLEHLVGPQRALRETARITKTKIVLSVPSKGIFYPLAKFLQKKLIKDIQDFEGIQRNITSRNLHLREYSLNEIKLEVKSAGLKIKEIRCLRQFPFLRVIKHIPFIYQSFIKLDLMLSNFPVGIWLDLYGSIVLEASCKTTDI